MSSVEDALVYWIHHSADEIDAWGDDDSNSIRDMIAHGFRAGWKLAGGDQRLLAVDLLQALVFECCGAKAGKQFCEGFGCKSVNDIRKVLGDTDLEDGAELEAAEDEAEEPAPRCAAVSAEGARCTLAAGGHTMHVPGDVGADLSDVADVPQTTSLAYDHCRLIEAELLMRKVDPPAELAEEYRGAVYAITQLSARVVEQMGSLAGEEV